MLKPGDIVIKTTGGNKMTINSIENNLFKCFWFVESKLNEGYFTAEDIVTLEDYKRFLKIEERDDKLRKLFN
jgi:uncharacterized protein YodC (DUF2158 family)